MARPVRERLKHVCVTVDADTYRVLKQIPRGDRSVVIRKVLSKIRYRA